LDEKMINYIRETISERLDEILIEALWTKSIEKSSKVSDEELEKLSEEIKQSAWEKLKKELKEKGLIND